MARYADIVAVRDALYEADAITMKGVRILNQFPTVSPDEVRGVGYNKLNEYHTLFQCSVCGWEDDDTITGSGETNTYNYCPNCGARMEVSEDA